MDISNRSLAVLLVITLVLVGTATGLTLGMSVAPTTAPLPPPDEVSVIPTVIREGGQKIEPSGPLTVAIEPDTKTESALLSCGTYEGGETAFKTERPFFEGGMGFETIPFNDCTVLLQGTSVPYGPVYPGDQLRCRNDQGRTACTGGIATEKAGFVSVGSAKPGTLEVDGEDRGELPISDMRLKVGKRALVVHLFDGRRMVWNLTVQPEEKLQVSFPDPAGAKGGASTPQASGG